MHVVSVSRRTDIPGLYWSWFLRRIQAGTCRVANPCNPRQVRDVSLRPEDVACLVFWTRQPRPLAERAGFLRRVGHSFAAHVTLDGYPRVLEPGVPETREAAAAVRA